MADLQRVTCMVRDHEDDFMKAIEKKANSCGKANLRRYHKELTEGEKRLREIDQIINKLFESKVLGDLSPERFATMLATYEGEQATLRGRLEELQTAINKEKEKTDGAEQFIRLVKRFSEITELTDEIVATFIQRVEVHEPVKVNGKKQHEITVFYNFIGNMSE